MEEKFENKYEELGVDPENYMRVAININNPIHIYNLLLREQHDKNFCEASKPSYRIVIPDNKFNDADYANELSNYKFKDANILIYNIHSSYITIFNEIQQNNSNLFNLDILCLTVDFIIDSLGTVYKENNKYINIVDEQSLIKIEYNSIIDMFFDLLEKKYSFIEYSDKSTKQYSLTMIDLVKKLCVDFKKSNINSFNEYLNRLEKDYNDGNFPVINLPKSDDVRCFYMFEILCLLMENSKTIERIIADFDDFKAISDLDISKNDDKYIIYVTNKQKKSLKRDYLSKYATLISSEQFGEIVLDYLYDLNKFLQNNISPKIRLFIKGGNILKHYKFLFDIMVSYSRFNHVINDIEYSQYSDWDSQLDGVFEGIPNINTFRGVDHNTNTLSIQDNEVVAKIIQLRSSIYLKIYNHINRYFRPKLPESTFDIMLDLIKERIKFDTNYCDVICTKKMDSDIYSANTVEFLSNTDIEVHKKLLANNKSHYIPFYEKSVPQDKFHTYILEVNSIDGDHIKEFQVLRSVIPVKLRIKLNMMSAQENNISKTIDIGGIGELIDISLKHPFSTHSTELSDKNNYNLSKIVIPEYKKDEKDILRFTGKFKPSTHEHIFANILYLLEDTVGMINTPGIGKLGKRIMRFFDILTIILFNHNHIKTHLLNKLQNNFNEYNLFKELFNTKDFPLFLNYLFYDNHTFNKHSYKLIHESIIKYNKEYDQFKKNISDPKYKKTLVDYYNITNSTDIFDEKEDYSIGINEIYAVMTKFIEGIQDIDIADQSGKFNSLLPHIQWLVDYVISYDKNAEHKNIQQNNEIMLTGLYGLTNITYNNSNSVVSILLGGEFNKLSYKNYVTYNSQYKNKMYYTLFIEKIIELTLKLHHKPTIDIYIEGPLHKIIHENHQNYYDQNMKNKKNVLDITHIMYRIGIFKNYIIDNYIIKEKYKKYASSYKLIQKMNLFSYSNILDNVRFHDIDIRAALYSYIEINKNDLMNKFVNAIQHIANNGDDTIVYVYEHDTILEIHNLLISLIMSEDIKINFDVLNFPWINLNKATKNMLLEVFNNDTMIPYLKNEVKYKSKFFSGNIYQLYFNRCFVILMDMYEVMLQLFYLDKNNRNDNHMNIPESDIVFGIYNDQNRTNKAFIFSEIKRYQDNHRVEEKGDDSPKGIVELISSDINVPNEDSFKIKNCIIGSNNILLSLISFLRLRKQKDVIGYENLSVLSNYIDCNSLYNVDLKGYKCLIQFCNDYATTYRDQFNIKKIVDPYGNYDTLSRYKNNEDEKKGGSSHSHSEIMLPEEIALLEYNYKDLDVAKMLDESFEFYNQAKSTQLPYSHAQEVSRESPLKSETFMQQLQQVGATGGAAQILNVILIVCVLLLLFVIYQKKFRHCSRGPYYRHRKQHLYLGTHSAPL